MFTIAPERLRQVQHLCHKFGVRRLALLGSAIRDDFGPASDIDVLVEFLPGTRTGLRLFGLEAQLSELLGRRIDLNTPGSIAAKYYERVQRDAREIYVAA